MSKREKDMSKLRNKMREEIWVTGEKGYERIREKD